MPGTERLTQHYDLSELMKLYDHPFACMKNKVIIELILRIQKQNCKQERGKKKEKKGRLEKIFQLQTIIDKNKTMTTLQESFSKVLLGQGTNYKLKNFTS